MALFVFSCAFGEWDETEAERAQPKLREYFEKAPLFPFEYDSQGEAVIRLIGTPQESFIFEQGRYFGFRFKTPSEITGDFRWCFLMSNPDGPVTMNDFAWYILRKAGDMKGFSTYRRDPLDYYPRLKSRFPHTGGVLIQTLSVGTCYPTRNISSGFGSVAMKTSRPWPWLLCCPTRARARSRTCHCRANPSPAQSCILPPNPRSRVIHGNHETSLPRSAPLRFDAGVVPSSSTRDLAVARQ